MNRKERNRTSTSLIRVQFHTHLNNHKPLNKVNSIDCILFYHYIAGNVWYMITCTSLCNFKKVDFCPCSLLRGTFSTNSTVSAKMYKKDSASKQAADSVHGNNEWKETRMLAKMYRLNAGVRNDNFHLELKLKVHVTEQYFSNVWTPIEKEIKKNNAIDKRAPYPTKMCIGCSKFDPTTRSSMAGPSLWRLQQRMHHPTTPSIVCETFASKVKKCRWEFLIGLHSYTGIYLFINQWWLYIVKHVVSRFEF